MALEKVVGGQQPLYRLVVLDGSNETNFSSIALYPGRERARRKGKGEVEEYTCSTLCLVPRQTTYNYIDDAFIYTSSILECEVILAC